MSRPDRPCEAVAAVATDMRASSITEMRQASAQCLDTGRVAGGRGRTEKSDTQGLEIEMQECPAEKIKQHRRKGCYSEFEKTLAARPLLRIRCGVSHAFHDGRVFGAPTYGMLLAWFNLTARPQPTKLAGRFASSATRSVCAVARVRFIQALVG